MKLNVDLSGLWMAVDRMGAKRRDLVLDDIWDDAEIEFDRDLSTGGVEITLDDLESTQGLLSARGRQVVLFIPDHAFNVEYAIQHPGEGNKFHVADCSTLDTMRRRNRFERYRVTNNLSGDFPVFGTSQITRESIEGTARLNVCKNCIKALNYKGADEKNATHRNNLVANFSLEEFFSTYSSVFKRLPSKHINDGSMGYAADWEKISQQVRKEAQYTCQSCHVNLTNHKRLLHVHHINGEKSDNSDRNLIALCADCHRKEPYHGHMMIPRKDTITINKLRTEQRGHDIDDWTSVLRLADPAVSGLLGYCRRKNWIPPIVGYELASPQRKRICELELAWPRLRVGVTLGEKIKLDGWKIYDLREALVKFK